MKRLILPCLAASEPTEAHHDPRSLSETSRIYPKIKGLPYHTAPYPTTPNQTLPHRTLSHPIYRLVKGLPYQTIPGLITTRRTLTYPVYQLIKEPDLALPCGALDHPDLANLALPQWSKAHQ